ncbi:MAG: TetR family transcriptional regulator [Jatrophihabitans sp.]|uniref:TetR family transcriptional regulator n=1 Tax=Jatrophihabitans sp. TaxID=1932789 RepID=UPI003F7F7600
MTERSRSPRAPRPEVAAARAGVESRAERKERTRQRLLDVTLTLIADRSLAGISLREVARDAGLVPTAFYRHFESMDALGVELVYQCMGSIRRMVRDARRGRDEHDDIIKSTVATLAEAVRDSPEQFRFLSRERYGGVAAVRRAIDTELRLVTSDLAVDLARLTAGFDWSTDDLEMSAHLMITVMLAAVMDLLESGGRREVERDILDRSERQLRLVALGMASWRSRP